MWILLRTGERVMTAFRSEATRAASVMTVANITTVLTRALAFVKRNWFFLLLGAVSWIVERRWGDGSLRSSDAFYAAFVGCCYGLTSEIGRRACSARNRSDA